jgi:enamine deaminase RidA (YjgF/YER057c/UK114 family)
MPPLQSWRGRKTRRSFLFYDSRHGIHISAGHEEGTMRRSVYTWLGREFVALSAEGRSDLDTGEQARELFQRLDGELRGFGLSLSHTIRTRLWGRDRESRDLGSSERVKALSGAARSASSSFIAPDFFESDARVGIELWAQRPGNAAAQKELVEYDPPSVPLRYLAYDGVVALSGVTAVLPTLDEQMADILPRITDSLSHAGVGWEDVVQVSFLMHRSQSLDHLKGLFTDAVDASIPRLEYGLVDGYSSPGKLVEVEVTAQRGARLA